MFSGTYVNKYNQEVTVTKKIPLRVYWKTETNVKFLNTNQTKDIITAIDEEHNKFKVNFEIDFKDDEFRYTHDKFDTAMLGIQSPIINGARIYPQRVNVTGGNSSFDSHNDDMQFYKRTKGENGEELIWDENNITKFNVEMTFSLDDIHNLYDDTLNIRIPVRGN